MTRYSLDARRAGGILLLMIGFSLANASFREIDIEENEAVRERTAHVINRREMAYLNRLPGLQISNTFDLGMQSLRQPVFPTVEHCSRSENQCWPGDCAQNLATNCACRHGFKGITVHGDRRCDLDSPPVMDTCQVSLTDAMNAEKQSGYTGNQKDCNHQRNEIINTQPTRLTFKIGASLNLSMGRLHSYVKESKVGVIGTRISVVKIDLTGVETNVTSQYFNTSAFCYKDVSSSHPASYGALLECNATIHLQVFLKDGESLCADMESNSGGFYTLEYEVTPQLFTPVSAKKRVCFLYDESKPTHCSERGCNSEPVQLSTRLTRHPEVSVHVEGWTDPVPRGGSESSVAHIHSYSLEIHNILTDHSPLTMDYAAVPNFKHEWNANSSSNGTYDITMFLPEQQPRLYAVVLKVFDYAGVDGNVAFARRFVLYDNSSTVDFSGTLTVDSANEKTMFLWQTNVNQDICVNWTGQFHNRDMMHNNSLSPVKQYDGSTIAGHYEQTTGLLPVSGTDNIDGVITFEMSWKRGNESQTPYKKVADLHSQRDCVSEPLKDGETYRLWVRATDIMGNNKVSSATVHIDHTGPQVTVLGLRGRLNRQGLYVHNSTDLSSMTLILHVKDPHSGVETFQVSLGTSYLSDDVARRAVGPQRLDNVTNCTGNLDLCYCPVIGSCENYSYSIPFKQIFTSSSSEGLHHREYYITINVTNNAKLITTEHVDILIDVSPPVVGVVFEGLSDDSKAEMDFTSNDVTHVRWHGFTDHESGIMMYLVVLADCCLTVEEVESMENATEVETGSTATIRFPKEGHYHTNVVAYNGAMQPSQAACSDGITFDSTPPKLHNVSIFNGRTGRAIACTLSNEPWLVNTDMTRTRLFSTAACYSACSPGTPIAQVEHLPLTSDDTLEKELSDDLCQRLTVMTAEHLLLLPSDYLRLQWAGLDEESHMEEFYVGIGRDRTTSLAPNLLSFTPTHGRHSYHARHAGLVHGALFYIFIRAVNKAGLDELLTLGPIIIDVTPPDVTTSLQAVVRDGFLLVTWTNDAFTDPEQPEGVDFEVSFRVGQKEEFITPILSLSESPLAHCLQYNVSGCARYPMNALQSHDTEQGRLFFFELHVTNAAGHTTSVNTSGVQLPAHLPPSYGMVMDVISLKAAAISTATTRTTTTTGTTTTTTFSTRSHLMPEFSKDIDVILQREDVCIAWGGFYHPENVAVEIGIGSSPNTDDVVKLTVVQNKTPACINATHLPVYTKLFSVVKATNSGGTTIFSSDGFVIVPRHDPENRLKIFNGKGCSTQDIIGTHILHFSDTQLDLSSVTEMPRGRQSLHPVFSVSRECNIPECNTPSDYSHWISGRC